MLILLDIGNTAVTYGVYRGRKLSAFGSILFDSIPYFIDKNHKSGMSVDNINIVISSVVPKNTDFLKTLISKKNPKKFKIWIAGGNLPIPIRHRYKPGKLGTDRAVNIYGALRLYKPPLLILDYGTAITFDYVSRSGVFEGGMILPGPEIGFQALIKRAALLPKKARLPRKAASFIGRDTYECMRSGILEGYGALSDGLIERFRERYGKNLKVIATGGFASVLRPYTRLMDITDPKHSIKSLFTLFTDFQKVTNPLGLTKKPLEP